MQVQSKAERRRYDYDCSRIGRSPSKHLPPRRGGEARRHQIGYEQKKPQPHRVTATMLAQNLANLTISYPNRLKTIGILGLKECGSHFRIRLKQFCYSYRSKPNNPYHDTVL